MGLKWKVFSNLVEFTQNYSYTQVLYMDSASTVQFKLICFPGGHFADLVMSWLMAALKGTSWVA